MYPPGHLSRIELLGHPVRQDGQTVLPGALGVVDDELARQNVGVHPVGPIESERYVQDAQSQVCDARRPRRDPRCEFTGVARTVVGEDVDDELVVGDDRRHPIRHHIRGRHPLHPARPGQLVGVSKWTRPWTCTSEPSTADRISSISGPSTAATSS
ncbi:Uncharacterised protein [Mycobacteroides abscessus subsp. abscessus]|nr:Uncharacterised protein [Mycobacteroides abscessus subsp. abscessus]